MSNSATQVRTAQIGGGRISDGPANLRASFSASKVSAGERASRPHASPHPLDLREQVYDFDKQNVITKDNISPVHGARDWVGVTVRIYVCSGAGWRPLFAVGTRDVPPDWAVHAGVCTGACDRQYLFQLPPRRRPGSHRKWCGRGAVCGGLSPVGELDNVRG